MFTLARKFPGNPDRKLYMRKYDAQHQTSDDYTLMLEDVPREASEVWSRSGRDARAECSRCRIHNIQ